MSAGFTLKSFGVVVLALLMSACAGMPSGQPEMDQGKLYEGDLTADLLGVVDAATEKEALAKGDNYWARGDSDRALLYYIRALDLNKKSFNAAAKIAGVHQHRGNAILAEQAWRTVLAIDDEHVMALEAMGLLKLEQRDYIQANGYLQKALDLWKVQTASSEKDQPIYTPWLAANGLGVIEDLNRKYPSAVAHYHRALEMAPNQPMLLNNLGYSSMMAGKLDHAEAHLRKALRIKSDYGLARRNLALVLTRRNQSEHAVRVLTPVMGEAAARNDVGYMMMLNDQPNMAEKLFRQAIELSPSYYDEAWKNLGQLKELRG
ncbi:tetratricopeptide repeat protein [Endozoicomonas atrinae]|uniref:tetratricopeptide repeat protein n=1 Tax=Endozoicomonas atrinae TaxID=1333660 RepID=UPI000825DEFD|nr:tetratricopeptide repeat protein [Endozoicomonas atrinae]